jgi:hypothetical protein
MGFDFHITRHDPVTGEEGPPISQEEWLAYVASDPEIAHDDEHPDPGTSFLYAARPAPWQIFWDESKEVFTTYPPADVVAKLVRIAKALGAHVLDDDGDLHS